jgi:hypothetical protein
MTVAISSGLFGSMCKEHRFIRESTPVNRREFRPSANSPPPRQPRLCELCAALASRAEPYKVRRLLHSSSKGPNRHQSEGAFPCCTVLILAGLDRANLPITLATVAPASASHGIEGWTSYDADGNGERIFVYTGSDMFRCARWPFRMRQCLVRLASALVHEAWHFENGRNEQSAYEVQIVFLLRNGAETEHVKAVRLAQNRVLAEERRATADAWQRFGSSPVAR